MTINLNNKIIEYDVHVQEILNCLDYVKLMTPINLSNEMSTFKDSVKNNKIYNPTYKYEISDIDYNRLRSICNIDLNDSLLEQLYSNFRDYLYNEINLYEAIGNSGAFTEISTSNYGLPNDLLIKDAYEYLRNNKLENYINNDPPNYTGEHLKEVLLKRLEEYGFEWEILLEDNLSTKVTIESDSKKIYMNNRLKYSRNDILRLMVHEIDTHVIRSENGDKQPYKIFKYGTANYLATEEGLAVNSEYVNQLLDNRTLKIYAARVIATHMCINFSFYDIYTELSQFLTSDDALYVTQRVKKGTIDTSKPGGFTKDYVYYYGFKLIRQLTECRDDLDILYVGSIGVEDIDIVKNLISTDSILPPHTLPNINSRSI